MSACMIRFVSIELSAERTIYTGRLINVKQYHFKIRQHIYMTGEDPPPGLSPLTDHSQLRESVTHNPLNCPLSVTELKCQVQVTQPPRK